MTGSQEDPAARTLRSGALHRTARLGGAEWRITLLLGATFALAGYDSSLLSLALPQIQAGLGIADTEIGRHLALVRLGIVPAFGLAALADVVGRRRLLIVTVLGFALCHAGSALARGPLEFTALQLAAHSFALAEEMIAVVALAEHVSARSRGFALGVLGTLEDVGRGHASVSFGLIGGLEGGWRWLYAAGVAPLLGIAWLRRGLRETPSFELARRRARDGVPLERPWSALRRQPRSLAAIVALAAPLGFVGVTALTFASKLLQQEHGYTPRDVTVLFVGAGVLLLPASLGIGALADRLGRRLVLAVLVLLHAAGAAVLCTSTADAAVVGGWLCMMLGWTGCEVLVSAVAAELFPTSCRVTATGASAIALAIGGALGLWTESALAAQTGAHGAAILRLIPALSIAVLATWVLPETAARELEEISPDRVTDLDHPTE